METPLRSRHLICFGAFEFDPHTGELCKHGVKLKLHGQPIEALVLLLEHPGELVTREELRQRLWPAETFVDYEQSLNAAVKRLREALDDSADKPRFIETLPRHGYRFIAPVDDSLTPDSTTHQTEQESPSLHSQSSSTGREGTTDGGASEGDIPRQDKELSSGRPRQVRAPSYKIGALAAGLLVGFAAVVIALNMGGLRDRLLSVVGGQRTLVSTPRIESIAVLPLENLSGDKEQEYFADGMTEALITDLGKIGALRVISRTSVMQYKGTKKPLTQIARELNVDAIVEGTVQRSGDRVRITANLLHAPTDRHLWADAYERDLRDVLALQDEVARAIASEIQIKVTPNEQARLASARAVNPEAYRLYLIGRFFWNKRTEEGFKQAIVNFDRAIEIDPNYPAAYAGLADAHSLLGDWGHLPPRDAYPKARAAALKALQINETSAEAHTSLALIYYEYDWNWPACEKEFKRAIELNPSYATAHQWYSEYLSCMRRHTEALAEAQRAEQLDPLSPVISTVVANSYLFVHKYDEAISRLQKTVSLFPEYPPAHWYLGDVYVQKGNYEQAIAAYQKGMTLSGATAAEVAALGQAYAKGGIRGYYLCELQRLREELKHRYVRAFAFAWYFASLDEKDQACSYLEKAYADRDWKLTLIQSQPRFDPLRSDPRFQDLLRRMNFPP